MEDLVKWMAKTKSYRQLAFCAELFYDWQRRKGKPVVRRGRKVMDLPVFCVEGREDRQTADIFVSAVFVF
jgi:hypothetical protein